MCASKLGAGGGLDWGDFGEGAPEGKKVAKKRGREVDKTEAFFKKVDGITAASTREVGALEDDRDLRARVRSFKRGALEVRKELDKKDASIAAKEAELQSLQEELDAAMELGGVKAEDLEKVKVLEAQLSAAKEIIARGEEPDSKLMATIKVGAALILGAGLAYFTGGMALPVVMEAWGTGGASLFAASAITTVSGGVSAGSFGYAVTKGIGERRKRMRKSDTMEEAALAAKREAARHLPAPPPMEAPFEAVAPSKKSSAEGVFSIGSGGPVSKFEKERRNRAARSRRLKKAAEQAKRKQQAAHPPSAAPPLGSVSPFKGFGGV